MMSFRIQEERQKPLNTNCQSFIDVCITSRYIYLCVYTYYGLPIKKPNRHPDFFPLSFLYFLSFISSYSSLSLFWHFFAILTHAPMASLYHLIHYTLITISLSLSLCLFIFISPLIYPLLLGFAGWLDVCLHIIFLFSSLFLCGWCIRAGRIAPYRTIMAFIYAFLYLFIYLLFEERWRGSSRCCCGRSQVKSPGIERKIKGKEDGNGKGGEYSVNRFKRKERGKRCSHRHLRYKTLYTKSNQLDSPTNSADTCRSQNLFISLSTSLYHVIVSLFNSVCAPLAILMA